jgi:hypothetical protein
MSYASQVNCVGSLHATKLCEKYNTSGPHTLIENCVHLFQILCAVPS